MFKKITALVYKEFLLEWRHKSGTGGVLIYSLSSIYICYLAFREQVDMPVWNALLWIIILFTATNAVAKSFMSETRGQQLFYYSLLNPLHVIIIKSLYNMLFLVIITSINFLAYMTLLGGLILNFPMFAAGLLLGVCALSNVLTLVSALASRAGNNVALMAILGFPLLIPVLITVIRFTGNAIAGISWEATQPYLIVLVSLNILISALSFLLFPYLWRD